MIDKSTLVYQIKELEKMIEYEESLKEEEQYGFKLHHNNSNANSKVISLETDALKLIIEHYKKLLNEQVA